MARRYTWKDVFIIFLTNLGLLAIVIVYMIFGAFMFQYLEGNSILPEVSEVFTNRMQAFNEINLAITGSGNMTAEIHAILKKFQDFVFEETSNGWSGHDYPARDATEKWNIAAAFLFSITIVTTIGYGNISPKTGPGQIFVIVYGTFGIPLTLLCLSNIGMFLAAMYRITWKNMYTIYTKIFRRTYNKRTAATVPVWITMSTTFGYLVLGAVTFSKWEGWSLQEGVYFSFVTLSTIGFGDYVPGAKFDKANRMKGVIGGFYVIFGIAFIAMVFDLVQESVINTIKNLTRCVKKSLSCIVRRVSKSSFSSFKDIKSVKESIKEKPSPLPQQEPIQRVNFSVTTTESVYSSEV